MAIVEEKLTFPRGRTLLVMQNKVQSKTVLSKSAAAHFIPKDR